MIKNDKLRVILLSFYIGVPFIFSVISTYHLVDLLSLGNPSWLAVLSSIAIEFGAIASFLSLSVFTKLNKSIVWSMFFLLFFLQLMGNVYFSYSWISEMMTTSPRWIYTAKEMLSFFVDTDDKTVKMILALVIGVPPPMISIFLLKSTTDYIGNDSDEKKDSTDQIHIREDIQESEDETSRKSIHPAL